MRADICDRAAMDALLAEHKPRAILHFAAESHVDRSIHGPADFVQTNVVGTFTLLEATRAYWSALPEAEKQAFRFLHVSTDEVFGSLSATDPQFSETTPYAPNSPYSATKAGSDHLVRAYHHTYGLPVLTTNCSNNYGPYQFPEKLIPLMIANALGGQAAAGVRRRPERARLAVCGRSLQRDSRSARARHAGRDVQRRRVEREEEPRSRAYAVRPARSAAKPKSSGSYRDQITYVKDRPGHDRRYAIDARKLERELGWKPAETFETGLAKTVQWYLDNQAWADEVASGEYRKWVETNYAQRA